MSRFIVIWLDSKGFADYAEHFEQPDVPAARKYLANRLAGDRIKPGVFGYLITWADSDFIRRFITAPGGKKHTRSKEFEIELALKHFPHLDVKRNQKARDLALRKFSHLEKPPTAAEIREYLDYKQLETIEKEKVKQRVREDLTPP